MPWQSPGAGRTRRHYAELLAPIYRWMIGDWSAALERARAEWRELGVGAAQPGSRAIDLGAGIGLGTVPLVELGYEVTAVDNSAAMLAELSAACPRARAVEGDLAAAGALFSGAYRVISCLGDTLPHLGSEGEVRALLDAAAAHLAPGGLLVLTFRDFSGPPRLSTDRFFVVRADADRILTCFLDYRRDRVSVTDILLELSTGRWTLRASEYEKLRLSPRSVSSALASAGLSIVRQDSAGGRVTIVAQRPETEVDFTRSAATLISATGR